MAELMMPTTAPTIAPTSHARVESMNPEPLVIWNERQFAELLSSEELMLEVASLHSAEQRSHSDAVSVNTPRTFAAAWTPTGSPTSTMSMLMPPLPPREIVFQKTNKRNTSINNSTSTAVTPSSPRSPHRAPQPRDAEPSSQHSLLLSPSTPKGDSMASLSSWELQAVRLPSIDMAVPLTRELSLSQLPPRTLPVAAEEPKSVVDVLLNSLSTLQASEETRSIQRSPWPPWERFVEARVTTFLNNVEFLTGIPFSVNRQLLKGADDKEDKEESQVHQEAFVALTESSWSRETGLIYKDNQND